jgi:hypothetical protein
MTELRLPPLVVDYNQLWLEADVTGKGDAKAWARRAAAELLSRPQWAGCRTPDGEKRLTAVMERAAAIAREAPGASMGFLLVPSPEDAVKGLATFCPVDLAGRDRDEAWTDLVGQLTPELPGDFPTDNTVVQTKAGECRRLLMRYPAGHGPERPVGQHVAYLWVFEDYGAAVIMSMSFASLLEAGQWLPALDQLAADAWLQRYPGEGEGGES